MNESELVYLVISEEKKKNRKYTSKRGKPAFFLPVCLAVPLGMSLPFVVIIHPLSLPCFVIEMPLTQ